ncbi:glutamic-type intramembrane protease PrsW [Viridibacillus sp. FSL E2-0187]|uniref:glutamic-type intramembrane protease PrsW n=1 Tax=Viridibacillus TaxID=496496 RepID=UPI00187B194F|nr:glutamic-type intramembrane protease PrsW [Viridibacillus sp. JNUCC-6]QOV11043.1 intramembrane metalloprotease PrsW [Viridibacillus sp. JNUCC-6]
MFILLTVAIAPGLALFSFFYLRNQMATEPRRTLFHTFIYGAILTFPILFLQYVFQEEQIFSNPILENVVFTGVIEEFFKWLILMIAIYHHVEFDDPYDGVLYGVAISLGFATVENILYLLSYGVNTAFLRALMPVSSHALFGVVMGYYLGKSKFSKKEQVNEFIVVALCAPILLHNAYNLIFFFQGHWSYLMIPFMLFLWWFGLRKVKQAHNHLIQHLYAQKKI